MDEKRIGKRLVLLSYGRYLRLLAAEKELEQKKEQERLFEEFFKKRLHGPAVVVRK